MSFSVFVCKALLREWTHWNNTPKGRRRETALEKNLLNKYSRKQGGNSATSLLYLALVATATYLVYWQRDRRKTDFSLLHINSTLSLDSYWLNYFTMVTESSGNQCHKGKQKWEYSLFYLWRQTTHIRIITTTYINTQRARPVFSNWLRSSLVQLGFSQIFSITKHWQKKLCHWSIKSSHELILIFLMTSETLRSWTHSLPPPQFWLNPGEYVC